MLTLLLFTTLYADDVLTISEPVIRFLSLSCMAVAPDGTLYVLDQDEQQVLTFSPAGKPGKAFARKGDGPGELSGAYAVHVSQDLVAVADAHGLNLFKPDGSFVKRGGRGLGPDWRLTKAGAVGGRFLQGLPVFAEDAAVAAVGPELEVANHKELLRYPRPPMNNSTTVTMSSKGLCYNYCPIPDNFFLTGTADGQWVQLYFPQAASVRIIDGTTNGIAGEIKLAPGPKPNQAWLDKMLEVKRDPKTDDGHKMTLVPQIPETCPRLRLMRVIGDQLYLVFWTASPDQEQPVKAFTPDGKAAKARFSGKALSRLAGLAGDRAWIMLPADEDDAMPVPALIPLAKLEQIVAPLPFNDR